MPTILSYKHVELIINGHRFESWSDDDTPVEFPEITFVETTIGRDGTMSVVDTGALGGELVVNLLSTSRSAQRIIQWIQERNRGARSFFEGTFSDTELGYSVQLKGGVLKMAKPTVTPGETYTATFEFEEMVPDFDGANFAGSPAVGT